jgi:hypothetical protein
VSAPLTPLAIITAVLGSGARADAVMTALSEAGWVCVPRVPTVAMLNAAWADAHAENAEGVWEEMLAVAASIYPVNSGNSSGLSG